MSVAIECNWLDGALLDAHARDDHEALIGLYEQAGLAYEKAGDENRACFYFTHAYVFALEQGSHNVDDLKARLVGYDREH